MRDTDADWVRIGDDDPYWGVFSSERFRKDNIQSADIDALYRTGQEEIDSLVKQATGFLGAWPAPRHALDFGCGVGRLSLAMQAWAETVTGVDISPGMLGKAKARAGGRKGVRFTTEIPAEAFDWMNSYIVFQHIPPDRGLAILDTLLGRLSPGGIVTLHFTLYREEHLQPQRPRTRTGIIAGLRRLLAQDAVQAPPVGAVHMYDYPLNEIVRRLTAHGVERLMMIPTRHGDGHHGVHVVGQRTLLQAG